MEIVNRNVPLADIGKTVGPRPPSRFIRSVRRHGVIVPVLLEERFQDDGSIRYHLIDGNRRVAAARRVKSATIPARVLQGISPDEAARVTLATNSYRSSNYVTEFWAIKQLERSGVNRGIIAQDAGMSESVLETRELLSKLDRRIFVGFVEGKVPPTTTLAAARLPRDIQDLLGSRFVNAGRLLKRDVDAATPWRASEFPPIGESHPQLEDPMPMPDPWNSSTVPSPRRTDETLRTETGPPLMPPSPIHPAGSTSSCASPDVQTPSVVVNVPDAAQRTAPISLPPFGGNSDLARGVSPASPARVAFASQKSDTSMQQPSEISSMPRKPQPHSGHPAGEGSVAPVEGSRVVPDDIKLALGSIARQAGNVGVDEEAWVAAAREVYRDNWKHRFQ